MKKFTGTATQILFAQLNDKNCIPLASIGIVSEVKRYKVDNKNGKPSLVYENEYTCDNFIADIDGLTKLIQTLEQIKTELSTINAGVENSTDFLKELMNDLQKKDFCVVDLHNKISCYLNENLILP